MSESQSRYSIIERLTTKKLSFLDDRTELTNEIERTKQRAEVAEAQFVQTKARIMQTAKQDISDNAVELSQLKSKVDYLESSLEDKEKVIVEKIKEIDTALAQLEAVSKSAGPTE